MKAIKNYESFKKSLLSSTNGTIVESFDSSNIFNGCEYQSYRVYVDDVHYYNMFVIYNFATNTYDVSLETSMCAVSTMSRVVKTISAKIENINHCPNQNTCCIVSPLVHCNYNYKSDSCIKAHKNFIHDCEQVHKQMKAISNPEWHHVSLKTLANIDFDMLDEKRKLVCDINQILKDGIRNLYKCENHISFEVLERYVIRKCDELIRHNRLKAFWFSYIARQLDEVRRNTIYLYTPYITAHRNRC